MQLFKQFLMENIDSEPQYSKYKQFITPEMEEHYMKRTLSHIEKVQDNGKILLKCFPFNSNDKFEFISIIKNHDASKWEEPERSLYMLISWRYHVEEDKFKELNIPEWLLNEMTKITEYHTKNNKHHPEYWDNSLISGFIDNTDRDKTDVMVNATEMPDLYILEMICDWCSVSEERGTDPLDWADNNVNKRWKFTNEQVDLIYNSIKLLKKEKMLGEPTLQHGLRYGYVLETDTHLFHLSKGIRCSKNFPAKGYVKRVDGEWTLFDSEGNDITKYLVQIEAK